MNEHSNITIIVGSKKSKISNSIKTPKDVKVANNQNNENTANNKIKHECDSQDQKISENELLATMNEISKINYVKKSSIKLIENCLARIMANPDDDLANYANEFMKIIKKAKLNTSDKKEIEQLKQKMTDIIKNYDSNNVNNNDKINNSDDEKTMTIDDIEKKLDKNVPKYNKYTRNNPMMGISWDVSRDRYAIKYNNINDHSKNLEKCVKIIIDKIREINFGKIVQKIPKNYFVYKNENFMIYWYENEPYFDIQHIMSVLNTKKTQTNEKYNEFSEEIKYIALHKNEFEGYIFRELINEKTMYKMILSSNSIFSKSFKSDIADILSEFRKNNMITITNEKIKINTKNVKSNINTDAKLHDCIDIIKNDVKLYSHDSRNDSKYIEQLIKNGKKIPLQQYNKKNMLYAFIILLPCDHDFYIVKFGYTDDIMNREKTLQEEYKAKVFLIGVKLINTPSDEKKFHNILKMKYPSCIQEYTIGNKKKKELYKFSNCLLVEFNNYDVLNNDNKKNNELSCLANNNLDENASHQDTDFVTYLDQYRNDQHKEYLHYKIIKEQHSHEQIMADKQMDMLRLKYANIDKDIELINAQVKLENILTNKINSGQYLSLQNSISAKD